MAGLHLDGCLRIACGRVVRDRGMAEVMEAPERLVDCGFLDRWAEVGPADRRGVERRAEFAVTEHEVGVHPIASRVTLTRPETQSTRGNRAVLEASANYA